MRGPRPIPRLHVVTDDAVLGREGWRSTAAEVLSAGGGRLALHVRGPRASGRRLYEAARALLGAAHASGAALIVNDRLDVALALPVSGVHLGERSLPIREVRRLLGEARWLGASVHGPERARSAEDEGADYLVVGTVFATPSHPDRPAEGVGLLARTGDVTRLPLMAIGGVTPERVSAVRRAGGHGVAVVRGIWEAADPVEAVCRYLGALDDRSTAEAKGADVRD